MSSGIRKLALAGCLVGAGMLSRKAMETAYKKSTGNAPPKNPAANDVGWTDALIWSAALGMVVGLTKTSVRRIAAEANDGRPIGS